MKKNFLLIITVFYVFIYFSCNSKTRKIEDKIVEWQNKTIILPKTNQFLYQDSIYTKEVNNIKSQLKIATFLWGDCHVCIADLKKWKKLYAISKKDENLTINFYLFTSNLDHFRKLIYSEEVYEYPLLLDNDLEYFNKNNLPDDKLYQTFLLDSTNKVILVGNPIFSEELEKLYIKEIKERLNNTL